MKTDLKKIEEYCRNSENLVITSLKKLTKEEVLPEAENDVTPVAEIPSAINQEEIWAGNRESQHRAWALAA